MSTETASERLAHLGWNAFFEQQLARLAAEGDPLGAEGPQRVVSETRRDYTLLGSGEPRLAVLAGRLRHALPTLSWPVVGDWVLTEPGSEGMPRIAHVFERSSVFARKEPGRSARGQAIAANVDLVVIVAALAPDSAGDFALHHGLNQRRIERALRAVSEAGAHALVVVNKCDLRSDAAEVTERLRRDLAGAELLLMSAEQGIGIEQLRARIGAGTAVLVGSSGVGKSSLTNRLLGRDAQRVSDVREADTRGRHTTTHRELFPLPGGGVLVDTPGMRELALWSELDEHEAASGTGFSDIDEIAQRCRFGDCTHEREPGCAVRAAIEGGTLSADRLSHALTLKKELDHQRGRESGLARHEARRRGRVSSRLLRDSLRHKGRKD